MRVVLPAIAALLVLGCRGEKDASPQVGIRASLAPSPFATPPLRHSEVMEKFRADRRWASVTLRGLTEREARHASSRRGLRFRVVRREGRSLFRTGDRVLSRVNADVRGGVVTRVALY